MERSRSFGPNGDGLRKSAAQVVCTSTSARTAANCLARLLRQMKSTHSHRIVRVTSPEASMIKTSVHTGKVLEPPDGMATDGMNDDDAGIPLWLK